MMAAERQNNVGWQQNDGDGNLNDAGTNKTPTTRQQQWQQNNIDAGSGSNEMMAADEMMVVAIHSCFQM